MEERATNFFLEYLSEQIRFFQFSVTRMLAIYNSRDKQLLQIEFWYHVQSALVAAANISKLFWPIEVSSHARGQELRALLNISEYSGFKMRNVRNHWEHFDERLDQWAIKPGVKGMADSNIIPLKMISGLNPDDFFRNYDPQTGEICFQGDVVNLPELFKESETIQAQIGKAGRSP